MDTNHAPATDVATKIDTMPDYLNQFSKATYEKRGKFEFGAELADFKSYPRLGPYQYKNLAYEGQWKDGKFHG